MCLFTLHSGSVGQDNFKKQLCFLGNISLIFYLIINVYLNYIPYLYPCPTNYPLTVSLTKWPTDLLIHWLKQPLKAIIQNPQMLSCSGQLQEAALLCWRHFLQVLFYNDFFMLNLFSTSTSILVLKFTPSLSYHLYDSLIHKITDWQNDWYSESSAVPWAKTTSRSSFALWATWRGTLSWAAGRTGATRWTIEFLIC